MSMAGERLPYPGLRSFTREETDLFFGREGCVDQMVDRLAATRFLAVLGASGSGKSSLVKTGLLDALDLGFLAAAGSRWLVAQFKPGDRPIANMARGLLRVSSDDPTREPGEDEVRILRALLLRSPRSIVEWCSDNLEPGTNLLLLVDQFEELFRYGQYSEREEAEAFAALLLESARAPLQEARIYVAITMRSEYLGAAALIDGLAEAINRGLYLTPRMSREEVREAIVGPAAVCGFEIEPVLVNRLLNDLTSFAPWEEAGDSGRQLERLVRRADQLPLMQHVLNRMWSIAQKRSTSGKKVLTLKDYQAVGGLSGALGAHGQEILDGLLPEHRAVAPTVFRALTSGSSLAEAVRRETKFGELVQIAHGDQIAVREIVDAFRGQGRNFLTPPRPEPLNVETVVDISHESLIRQWKEFATWLQQEIDSAASWRRLVDQAERHQRGEADLLSGVALATIANWWDAERPTAAWAKRYGGNFDAAKAFLEMSRRTEEAAKKAEFDERRRKTRRRVLAAAVVMLGVTVTAGLVAYFQTQAAQQAERQRLIAVEAQQTAEEQRLAALEAQEDAEEAAREAEVAREAAAASAQAAEEEKQRAEAEKERADQERERALTAQREAEFAAADAAAMAAEAERQRQEAEDQREEAEEQRQLALVAQQAAQEAAAQAQRERERADKERASALLELASNRILALQLERGWVAASNILGGLWEDYISSNPLFQSGWFVEPLSEAFVRQRLAEYPIVPDFLEYGGLQGWSGSSGRFRIYALDREAEDGTLLSGNKIIGVFDAMTGTVTGSFELPPGADLGSEVDLVTPDGRRAAIVTNDKRIALWGAGQTAPTMIPLPPSDDDSVDASQLAPVHSDDRFALYLTRDYSPGEIQVIDPATAAAPFVLTAEKIADDIGLESIYALDLLGLVDGKVYALLNQPDGLVVEIDVATGESQVLDTGVDVTGGAITPDGQVLLTLTCPDLCDEQKLTAYDLNRANAALWVERVPSGLKLAGNAVQEVTVDGVPSYGVLAENEGMGVVFQFPQGRPEERVRLDGGTSASIGAVSFDGDGGFRRVEAAGDDVSAEDVQPAGLLANYRVPASREKLSLYVAPNSVAVYRGGGEVLVGGVTYSGDLLVYRLEDGEFVADDRFRQVPIGDSACIAAIGFGGDGQSLLIRHIDTSLHYIAAVGTGASVGWHKPAAPAVPDPGGPEPVASPESRAELAASTPETSCTAPEAAADAVTERIVAVEESGKRFALLDTKGMVWRVNIADRIEAESEKVSKSVTRGFEPLERVASGVTWIAGDAARGRVALASRAAPSADASGKEGATADTGDKLPENAVTVMTLVSVAPRADAGAERGGGTSDDAAAGESEESSAPVEPAEVRSTLPRRGEPTAVAFTPGGGVVVAYVGGRLVNYGRANGSWTTIFDQAIAKATAKSVFASGDRIAVVDDLDAMTAYDLLTGEPIGLARIPADPSVLALLEDGSMLSVEWVTDGVATLTFHELAHADDIEDTARLVSMRSLLDPEYDASVDALVRERGEASGVAATAEAEEGACSFEAMRLVSQIEGRLLGEAGIDDALAPSDGCAHVGDSDALAAAARLSRIGAAGDIQGMLDDEAFSYLLQAAAAGDESAVRFVGAVLARVAKERGTANAAAIAVDAVRFGTSVPSAVLREIAAGAAIPPSLLEFANRRMGFDPAGHQLVANALERRINDIGALTEALFHYSVAERLYRDIGRTLDARFTAHRRAQLARLLPDDRVLDVEERRKAWVPQAAEFPASVAVVGLPDDVVARRELDLENVGRLVQKLPDSLLLSGLGAELERVRIHNLATSDPKLAAALLLELGRDEGGSEWSPELVNDYLALAEEITDDPESTFRLAIEGLKAIGAAFAEPIHANEEAVALFTRSADIAATAAVDAPADAVAAAVADLDLPLLRYEYATLPGTGEENVPLVTAAEHVFEAAARLADAISNSLGGERKWDTLRGDVLFWLGILVNDHDQDRAADIFQTSADALQPIVAKYPDDDAARLRYAEALRWVGLTVTALERMEAVETEALRHYAMLWEDRASLSDDMVRQVGVGYGYDLANLGQTVRQLNLADIADGRTAEEHAAWLLEVLALAAEKDAINATMIDMGVADVDSGFMAGWYRMSSYGFSIGFLSGLVNVESGGEPITDCDVRAADPYDPRRRAHGVLTDGLDTAEAEASCRTEVERSPDDARTIFQLARAIFAQPDRESEAEQLAREAAALGVAPAFSLVGSIIDRTDTSLGEQAHLAASQRVILESFPILYPFLAEDASTERERKGLTWYVERAAALGVPGAHLALVDSAQFNARKLFHAKMAARLFEEAGDDKAADAARRIAEQVFASQTESDKVDAEIAGWTPEALVALPDVTGATR